MMCRARIRVVCPSGKSVVRSVNKSPNKDHSGQFYLAKSNWCVKGLNPTGTDRAEGRGRSGQTRTSTHDMQGTPDVTHSKSERTLYTYTN